MFSFFSSSCILNTLVVQLQALVGGHVAHVAKSPFAPWPALNDSNYYMIAVIKQICIKDHKGIDAIMVPIYA